MRIDPLCLRSNLLTSPASFAVPEYELLEKRNHMRHAIVGLLKEFR